MSRRTDAPNATPQELFARLVEIIALLRSPNGCPWDREQTHESIKPYLLEEAYETLEAIDARSPRQLCEELGDLLIQVTLHAQMSSEADEFDICDVLATVNEKLIRRHPHVFGDVQVSGSEEVVRHWEAIKQAESRGGASPPARSILDDIPANLPALMLADKIQKRWAQVGFDWQDAAPAIEKLREEIREVESARETHDPTRIAQEVGDMLFAAVNVARLLGVDAEDALRMTINRVKARFAKIEEFARAHGKSLHEMTLEEMDAVWNAAK
ncbi:MAG: nucleoside triphosphate pyrophosphohydrolase [Abditibacteriales bacterium]|nr:nucleoside triphosphate pyrophosphohydrolase [Abditibacteriales bacterium]MDW8367454.1 nucleoside triphosphate pyrophosphohydrolase [Abditibacteriales bacterium]